MTVKIGAWGLETEAGVTISDTSTDADIQFTINSCWDNIAGVGYQDRETAAITRK